MACLSPGNDSAEAFFEGCEYLLGRAMSAISGGILGERTWTWPIAENTEIVGCGMGCKEV